MMTFRDIYNDVKNDIDIYDDYDERVGIAYCGTRLTDEGMEKYGDVLDYPVIISGDCVVITTAEMGTDEEIERKLNHANKMLYGMAGYCAESEYDKYFCDE